ncbi:alanine--tRNA ligase, partial [bacterium]|nr:alanine--tRNA ligase [bacterium]
KTDISLRIITDHARCVTFLKTDGVIPGNEGRSYVLRMILRRALRHGKILGMELPFLYKLVDIVVENYGKAYPELIQQKEKVINTIKKEEELFAKTLERGYKILEEFISQKKNIDGESAFKLYDTFGFPLELTREIAQENGLCVDEEGYKVAMQEQKDRAKAATQKISVTGDIKYAKIEKEVGSTEFLGYEKNESEAKILATVEGEGYIDVVLDKTPFYAECGGQVGDSGVILDRKTNGQELKLEVLTTFKVNDLYVHRCKVIMGEIEIGHDVIAKIDVEKREEIRIHHTSAHLLQAALVKVLGDEVKQAGSLVEENRMRFDFTFSRAMTPEEINKVENLVNTWVSQGYDVNTQVMSIEQAQQTGATALFGEKYGDIVRVVSIEKSDECISKEFCAGTHARNIRDLRVFKIVSEGAIAAGTRRIEVVVGKAAYKFMNERIQELAKLEKMFKLHYDEVVSRVEKLQDENREYQKEISELQEVNARNKFSTFISKAEDVEGGKLFVSRIEDFDAKAVRAGIELLSAKLGESIIVLASGNCVYAKVSDTFLKHGINAGKIVGDIARATGANGGGKPNFAQGGLKDKTNLDKILADTCSSLKC